MHDDAYISRRSENNVNGSCMTISGGRTKQLDIFCRVTGFTSDLLSFIVVEPIQFFHEAVWSTDTSDPGHFGPKTVRHYVFGTEMSYFFLPVPMCLWDTSAPVPNCLNIL